MAKPTKEQVDAVKLKYMKQKFGKKPKAAKKKSLDATVKKSDSTLGGAIKAIKKRKKLLESI